jgi:hypothetical protein
VSGTALDLYEGFFGIVGNTAERMMRNARIAGAAARAQALKADATQMPLPDASFDGVTRREPAPPAAVLSSAKHAPADACSETGETALSSVAFRGPL